MSIKPMFSVRDTASGAFGYPFVAPHVGLAVRAFGDEANGSRGDNDLTRHPEQFDLYQIGEFDDVTGVVTPLDLPKLVTNAAALKG